jgi:hypothetical protein
MWSTPNGYVIGDSVAEIAAAGLLCNISLLCFCKWKAVLRDWAAIR